MNIAATVILYHPDKKIIDNLLSYSRFVNTVYVYDNSEKPEPEIRVLLEQIPNCVYLHSGMNEGIARRLNEACIRALEDGFEFLLTMDQDSYFLEKSFSSYLACVENLRGKDLIAMTGVKINRQVDKGMDCKFEEVVSLITSGSIVNLTLFKSIGDFDEALFIDQVDLEYCYRSIIKGYKIIEFKNISLQHSLGISSVHRSLKTFKNTYRSLHSPIRIYYITRNYFYIRSKYKEAFPAEISKSKKDLIIRLKNNLLYGQEKLAVLRFFLKGLADFRRKRMGKIQ